LKRGAREGVGGGGAVEVEATGEGTVKGARERGVGLTGREGIEVDEVDEIEVVLSSSAISGRGCENCRKGHLSK